MYDRAGGALSPGPPGRFSRRASPKPDQRPAAARPCAIPDPRKQWVCLRGSSSSAVSIPQRCMSALGRARNPGGVRARWRALSSLVTTRTIPKEKAFPMVKPLSECKGNSERGDSGWHSILAHDLRSRHEKPTVPACFGDPNPANGRNGAELAFPGVFAWLCGRCIREPSQ